MAQPELFCQSEPPDVFIDYGVQERTCIYCNPLEDNYISLDNRKGQIDIFPEPVYTSSGIMPMEYVVDKTVVNDDSQIHADETSCIDVMKPNELNSETSQGNNPDEFLKTEKIQVGGDKDDTAPEDCMSDGIDEEEASLGNRADDEVDGNGLLFETNIHEVCKELCSISDEFIKSNVSDVCGTLKEKQGHVDVVTDSCHGHTTGLMEAVRPMSLLYDDVCRSSEMRADIKPVGSHTARSYRTFSGGHFLLRVMIMAMLFGCMSTAYVRDGGRTYQLNPKPPDSRTVFMEVWEWVSYGLDGHSTREARIQDGHAEGVKDNAGLINIVMIQIPIKRSKANASLCPRQLMKCPANEKYTCVNSINYNFAMEFCTKCQQVEKGRQLRAIYMQQYNSVYLREEQCPAGTYKPQAAPMFVSCREHNPPAPHFIIHMPETTTAPPQGYCDLKLGFFNLDNYNFWYTDETFVTNETFVTASVYRSEHTYKCKDEIDIVLLSSCYGKNEHCYNENELKYKNINTMFCGKQIYSLDTDICCGDTVINRADKNKFCCGNVLYEIQAKDDQQRYKKRSHEFTNCCGIQSYNRDKEVCCEFQSRQCPVSTIFVKPIQLKKTCNNKNKKDCLQCGRENGVKTSKSSSTLLNMEEIGMEKSDLQESVNSVKMILIITICVCCVGILLIVIIWRNRRYRKCDKNSDRETIDSIKEVGIETDVKQSIVLKTNGQGQPIINQVDAHSDGAQHNVAGDKEINDGGKRSSIFIKEFLVYILLLSVMWSLKLSLDKKTALGEVSECETCMTVCSPGVCKQSCSSYCKPFCDDISSTSMKTSNIIKDYIKMSVVVAFLLYVFAESLLEELSVKGNLLKADYRYKSVSDGNSFSTQPKLDTIAEIVETIVQNALKMYKSLVKKIIKEAETFVLINDDIRFIKSSYNNHKWHSGTNLNRKADYVSSNSCSRAEQKEKELNIKVDNNQPCENDKISNGYYANNLDQSGPGGSIIKYDKHLVVDGFECTPNNPQQHEKSSQCVKENNMKGFGGLDSLYQTELSATVGPNTADADIKTPEWISNSTEQHDKPYQYVKEDTMSGSVDNPGDEKPLIQSNSDAVDLDKSTQIELPDIVAEQTADSVDKTPDINEEFTSSILQLHTEPSVCFMDLSDFRGKWVEVLERTHDILAEDYNDEAQGPPSLPQTSLPLGATAEEMTPVDDFTRFLRSFDNVNISETEKRKLAQQNIYYPNIGPGIFRCKTCKKDSHIGDQERHTDICRMRQVANTADRDNRRPEMRGNVPYGESSVRRDVPLMAPAPDVRPVEHNGGPLLPPRPDVRPMLPQRPGMIDYEQYGARPRIPTGVSLGVYREYGVEPRQPVTPQISTTPNQEQVKTDEQTRQAILPPTLESQPCLQNTEYVTTYLPLLDIDQSGIRRPPLIRELERLILIDEYLAELKRLRDFGLKRHYANLYETLDFISETETDDHTTTTPAPLTKSKKQGCQFTYKKYQLIKKHLMKTYIQQVYMANLTFRTPLENVNYFVSEYCYFEHGDAKQPNGNGEYFFTQRQKIRKTRRQKLQLIVQQNAEKEESSDRVDDAIGKYFEQKESKDETILVTANTEEKKRIFSNVEPIGIAGTDLQIGTLKELELKGSVTIRSNYYGLDEINLKQKSDITKATSKAFSFDKFDDECKDAKMEEEDANGVNNLYKYRVKEVLEVHKSKPGVKKFTYKWPTMKQMNHADVQCRISSEKDISTTKEKHDEKGNIRANKDLENLSENGITRGTRFTNNDENTYKEACYVETGAGQREIEDCKSGIAISAVSNKTEVSTSPKEAGVVYIKYGDMDLKAKPFKTNTRKGIENHPIVPASYKEKVMMIRELTWRAHSLPVPNNQIEVYRVFEPLMTILGQLPTEDPPGPEITMRYELLRVCTLRNYPKHDKPYIIRLAGAGFYYAAEGDEVVCYTCGMRRHDWVEADVPMDIHKRIAPNCRFLTKNDEVNVPVPRADGPEVNKFAFLDEPGSANVTTAQHNSNRPSEDVSSDVTSSLAEHMGLAPQRQRRPGNFVRDNGQSQVVTANTRMTTVEGVNRVQPKHPDYAIKARRISSFQGWPDNLHQTPEILSDAGFYFAGVGDAVRCFFCGIGLRHWAEEDNPWIEHARWSRHCVYLKQLKGEEFINLVHMAVQYTQENDEQTASTPGTGNQLPTDELERLLLTDAAQSVLEVGYQPRIIKKAIEIVVREHGRDGFNSQRIIEKVIEIEEAEDAANIANNLQQMNLSNQTSDTTRSENTTEAEPRKTSLPTTGESAAASAPTSAPASNTREVTRTQQPTNPSTEMKAAAANNPSEQGATGLQDKKSKKETERYHPDSKSIKAENEKLKEQTVCKICLDNTVCIVFLPCGHLVTCAECAPAMRKCPMCRSLVKGTVKTFMA